jgi:hypothetical protein
MDQLWPQIVQVFGVYALAVAAIAWFLRAFLSERLRRDTERALHDIDMKSTAAIEDLKHRAAADLEALKHQYALALERQRLLSQAVHQKRVDLLADLYGQLSQSYATALELQQTVADPLTPNVVESLERLREQYEKAAATYHQVRLFLPVEVERRLQRLLPRLLDPYTEYVLRKESPEDQGSACRAIQAWPSTEVYDMLKLVGNGFRDLLGAELLGGREDA